VNKHTGHEQTLNTALTPGSDARPLPCSVRKHIVLKGLLKQPQLLAWLLEVRASYRAAAGLAALPAVLPAPATKPAAKPAPGAEVCCDRVQGCIRLRL
jgi:hypothetical protein